MTTALNSYLTTALGVPFEAGNRVEVLRNGKEIFPAMLQAIDAARSSIDLVTYVYWTGDIANKFAESLQRRAQDGVRVRVLLDAFGCKSMRSELVKKMQQAGVDVRWFRPIAQWKLWKWDNRTHRKVLVCDHSVAFTGGVGIASQWEGDARDPSEWRDTHFKITGPSVNTLHAGFLSNWSEACEGSTIDVDVPRRRIDAGDASIQVLRSASSIHWSDIALLFRLLIDRADSSLRITTAYFAPDEVLTQQLCDAAARGVAVTVMVPGKHTDSLLSQLSGEDKFRRLLDAGIEMRLYQRTMLHAKILLVDDRIAVVGSANMNHRSMSKDEEICLVIDDADTLAELRQHFEDDLQSTEALDIDRWHDRSVWQRGAELFSRVLREEV